MASLRWLAVAALILLLPVLACRRQEKDEPAPLRGQTGTVEAPDQGSSASLAPQPTSPGEGSAPPGLQDEPAAASAPEAPPPASPDPCARPRQALGTGTTAEPKAPLDFCNGPIPFPSTIGLPLDGPEEGIRTLDLKDGIWECEDQDEYGRYSCGRVDLDHLLSLDLDRDGRPEWVATFFVHWGGNTGDWMTFVYDERRRRPRFRTTLEAIGEFRDDVVRLEPFGQHCVQIVGECDKPCHACEGQKCHRIYAWNGRRFEIAETSVNLETEPGEPPEAIIHRDERLLARCQARSSRPRK